MVTIYFFVSIILPSKKELATKKAKKESKRDLDHKNNQLVYCKICFNDSIFFQPTIFTSCRKAFPKELEGIYRKIRGKGVRIKIQKHLNISSKIILWDEINSQNKTGVKFSN